jgi:hypothetical protein
MDCGRAAADLEDVDRDGEAGDVTLGGRAMAAASIDGGRDLITDDRFSDMAVTVFELFVPVRTEGSLALTLVVRERPLAAGD